MIKRVFPILALAIFSSMLGSGIVVPLLPLYAESLGASGLGMGMIFAAFPISRTLLTPAFGRLSDRLGRKPFITIGLLLYALISVGFIWADTVYLLIIIRLVHGVSGSMILPIAQAYVGDISPEGEEGRWMGYANAAFFSGFGVGPLLGGVVSEHLGMNVAFITMGGLNFLAFLISLVFLPEVGDHRSTAAPQLSFRQMGQSGMMKGLLSFRLALTLGRASFFAFLPILATIGLGLAPTLVGILLAIHILLVSMLGIPSGWVADRFSRSGLVVIGALVSFTYLMLVPMAPGFAWLLALVILGSLGNALAVPAASALAVEEGRKYGMGSAIAVISTAMSIGMAVGPIIAGAIIDLADINAAFRFGAAMALAGGGLFVWFNRAAYRTVTR